MTTETTQPQPEMGPAPDNGQASQAPTPGHRRRRRRRKNRSSQQNAQQGQQPQVQQPQQAAPPPQPQAPPQPPQHRQNQQHQNQPRKRRNSSRKAPALRLSPATASRIPSTASARANSAARASLSVPWTTVIALRTATWPMDRPPQSK